MHFLARHLANRLHRQLPALVFRPSHHPVSFSVVLSAGAASAYYSNRPDAMSFTNWILSIFQVVTTCCSFFTSPNKAAKISRKEEIERLSKLEPQDRTVIGEDGQTIFFPVIRRYSHLV